MNKWITFTKERFEPVSHFLMIALFTFSHILVSKHEESIQFGIFPTTLLILGTIAFYFKLRLYDEIKDYDTDLVINPTRPLPRGLLSHQDLYKGILICIIIELLSFSLLSNKSISITIITIFYSLLMFKEFFIKNIIRPHLTTYAITHTFVTVLLSLTLFSVILDRNILQILESKELIAFAISNWALFNIFEFGRKTFAKTEERDTVVTYSNLFGIKGAISLVLSQAIVTLILNNYVIFINDKQRLLNLIIFSSLLMISIFFAIKTTEKNAKLYRLYSSFYIIIYFLTTNILLLIY